MGTFPLLDNMADTTGPAVKVRALADLVRPELPLAAGVCVVAGEIIGAGSLPSLSAGLLGFLTGFFVSGAAMITNDYFDLEVDRVNSPGRPLPSGRVTVPELAALAIAFTAAGLVAAALLGPLALAIAAIMWAVSQLYNWRLKEAGLLGNAMVGLSVAMTFVCGGVIAGGPASGLVWTFGALAFVFDLAEEIASGAMDLEGDEKRSSQSIAWRYGKRFALRVSGLLFALFVLLSFLPIAAGWIGVPFLALFGPMGIAVAYFALKLQASRTPAEGHTIGRWMYLVVTAFVIVFVAVSAL